MNDVEFEEERTVNNKLVTELVSKVRALKNIYFNGKNLIANNLAGDIVFDKFNPADFSGVNRGFIVLNNKDKDIYVYDDGIYTPNGDDVVKCVARIILGDKATNQRVTEVVTAVKQMASLYVKVDDLNKYTNLINLKNGVFNIETGELLPHDKKYLFTFKINVNYNKDADCKRFKKFLEEIHVPEQIPLIQELFGYCLYPRYDYHKVFFCIGTGRNGKGTEQYVLKTLVGHENVSSTSIKQIVENPFMSAQLHNKLINIGGEVGEAKIFDTEIIKALSGGDSVTAQHKNKQPFDFINYAKLIFAVNKAPEIADDTTALWHRMIVIDYPNVFLDTDPRTDPNLREKLTTDEELSGIFNWAIEGLKRLKTNGRFTYFKTPELTKQHYDVLRNHVIKMVADEKLIYMPDVFIIKSMLYRDYKNWCAKQNPPVIPYNPVVFSKKLFEAVVGCTSDKIQINGKRVPIYMDIAYDDISKNKYTIDDMNIFFNTEENNHKQKLELNITQNDKLNSLKIYLEDGDKSEEEIINDNIVTKSDLEHFLNDNYIVKVNGKIRWAGD